MVFSVAEENTSLKHYVQIEELFNVKPYGKRDLKYKNITAECIMVCLGLCVLYLKKSKVTRKVWLLTNDI